MWGGVTVTPTRYLAYLNGINRGHQYRQFWSFIFHGCHLLSFVAFAFQLLAS